MKITPQICRENAQEKILSYDYIKVEYNKLLKKIENKSKAGYLDYLFYLDDIKLPEFEDEDYTRFVFEKIINLLQIDGFSIERFNNPEVFVNVGWR